MGLRRLLAIWRKPPAYWEFVYLDEVANQSLRATLVGSVLEKTIRRASWSETSGASLEAGAARASLAGSRSRETEVHERAVAESLFEDLRKELEKRQILRSTANPAPIRLGRSPSVAKILKVARRRGHCVALQSLRRGTPLETVIRLRPPQVLMAAAAIQSIAPLLRHAQDLGTALEGVTLEQFNALGEALSWFYSDSVPIVGDAVSHRVYSPDDGSLHLVTAPVALALEEVVENGHLRPLRIVGFCDERGFWQEPRRVLRHSVDFIALSRLEDIEPVDDWSDAEKIGDLQALGDDVADQAREAYDTVLTGLSNNRWQQPKLKAPTVQIVLNRYGRLLADEFHTDGDERKPAASYSHPEGSREASDVDPALLYQAFRDVEAVSSVIIPDAEDGANEKIIERLREKALQVDRPHALSDVDRPLESTSEEPDDDAVSLRVKFVAIYW